MYNRQRTPYWRTLTLALIVLGASLWAAGPVQAVEYGRQAEAAEVARLCFHNPGDLLQTYYEQYDGYRIQVYVYYAGSCEVRVERRRNGHLVSSHRETGGCGAGWCDESIASIRPDGSVHVKVAESARLSAALREESSDDEDPRERAVGRERSDGRVKANAPDDERNGGLKREQIGGGHQVGDGGDVIYLEANWCPQVGEAVSYYDLQSGPWSGLTIGVYIGDCRIHYSTYQDGQWYEYEEPGGCDCMEREPRPPWPVVWFGRSPCFDPWEIAYESDVEVTTKYSLPLAYFEKKYQIRIVNRFLGECLIYASIEVDGVWMHGFLYTGGCTCPLVVEHESRDLSDGFHER